MSKKRLFCLSGGGLPGLQNMCGQMMAAELKGIIPDAYSGNSAGAISASIFASGHSSNYYKDLLNSYKESDILKWKGIPLIRLFANKFLIDTSAIFKIISEHVSPDWSSLAKPLSVMSTDIVTGDGIEFNSKSNIELHKAILASMSISGVFPYVEYNNKLYSDGGTWNNLGLPSNWTEYDEVWLWIGSGKHVIDEKKDNIAYRLIRNMTLYARGQIYSDLLALGIKDTQLDTKYWESAIINRDGKDIKINVIWPDLDDNGILKFVPGQINKMCDATTLILTDMGI